MGEFDLEQRLKNLKSSYDDMPNVTSVDRIMDNIKDHEKPSNQKVERKFRFHLPYVASFIGVLLIVGVLAGQMLFGNDAAENNNAGIGENGTMEEKQENDMSAVPPEKEEVNERVTQLEAFRTEKEKKLRTALQTEEPLVQFTFVRDASAAIKQFGERTYETKVQMEEAFQSAQVSIEWYMMMPSEMLEKLEKEQDDYTPQELDDHLSDLLNKQEELLPLLQSNWNKIASEYNVTPNILEQLNEVESLKEESLRKEVAFFRDNGYRFIDAGEGMVDLQIDYTGLERDFPDSALVGYFKLIERTGYVARDAALIISWDQLSDLIVDLEQFMLQNPNFEKDPQLYGQYKRFLKFYLFGMDNSMTFHDNGMLRKEVRASYDRFLNKYQDTETYFILKSYYELLEKNKFTQTPEMADFKVDYPVLYNAEVDLNVGNIYQGNIFPLDVHLQDRYRALSGADSEQTVNEALEGLTVFDVMRLYMFASTNGDAETMYKLLIKGEKYGTPPKEKFMEDTNTVPYVDFQPLSDTLLSAEAVTTSNGDVVIMLDAGIYDGEKMGFQIEKNDADVWKVEFMPMQ